MIDFLCKVRVKVDVFRRFVFSVAYESYFYFVNRISSNNIDMSGGSDYIVSLTTYNKRLSKVYLTIESIFHQKTSFTYDVHLYLCDDDIEGELPLSLLRLKSRGLKIIKVNENIKSYKKLFFCFKGNKNKNIITVDDDIFYPPYWLDKIISCHIRNKGSVITFRGHMMSFYDNGNLKPYSEFIGDFSFKNTGYLRLIPTGVSGILYPVGSLDGLENDKEIFLKLSPLADDLWFKFVTLRNGYDSRLVTNKNIHFISILDTQEHSLRKTNLDGNHNDIQLNNISDHYPELIELIHMEYKDYIHCQNNCHPKI